MLGVRLFMELGYASSPLIPFSSRAQYTTTNETESSTTKNAQSLPIIIHFLSMSFVVADPNGAPNHHTFIHAVKILNKLCTTSSTSMSIWTRPATHFLKADVSHHYCHDPYKGLVTLSDLPHSCAPNQQPVKSTPWVLRYPRQYPNRRMQRVQYFAPFNHWTILATD